MSVNRSLTYFFQFDKFETSLYFAMRMRYQMSEIKDFLNPNSMLTPGIAGGITMMIANSLWVNFDFPPKFTAIILCLLLGLMVLAELKAPLWQKPVYYIINVLIIFSVSAGSNVVGMSASQQKLLSELHQSEKNKVAGYFLDNLGGFFINNANAADTSKTKKQVSMSKVTNQNKKLNSVVATKTGQTLKPIKKTTGANNKGKPFFRPWF